MGFLVIKSALVQCSFGTAPGSLGSMTMKTKCSGQPACTIMDNKPQACIPSFVMCQSIANPTVASATAAAYGALTPQACNPVTSAPWVPGVPTVMIEGNPALNDSSMCMCNWAGVIKVSFAGQVQCKVP